jgi:hypothetical protein
MLDKTEPWLMGEAEGVAEAMILGLRLRDMVEDKPTEDETSVVPVGVTGVEVNERTADEVVSPTVDATLLLDTVVCDGDPDVTTVGFDVQTPGGVLQVIKPKKQPA